MEKHDTFFMACSRQPEVLWAQRSEKVYLTISVPDAEDVVLKIEPQGILSFSAIAHGESFSLTLELFDSVLPEVSICGLQFYIVIQGWFQLILPYTYSFSTSGSLLREMLKSYQMVIYNTWNTDTCLW
jgi:hypothetical protein